MNMLALMYVAVGGAVGSVLRYLMTTLVTQSGAGDFPYGTLLVNVVGGFLMGAWIVVYLSVLGPARADGLHKLLAVGLLGGFTTFSAFSLDIYMLMDRGLTVQATFYILGSVALSLFALIGGMQLMRVVMG